MQFSSSQRQAIAHLLASAGELRLSKSAITRLEWFAFAAAHGGNVSLTCRYFGVSRTTFLRWANRFRIDDPSTLCEHSRRPHRVRAPQTDPHAVDLIRALREQVPTMGKAEIARRLFTDHGITLSASTVGRVIERHRLFFADLPSHQRKRTARSFHEDDGQSASHFFPVTGS